MHTVSSNKISSLSEILLRSRRITLTSHARPDGDALGCVTGFLAFVRAFYEAEVKVVLPDSISENIAFIIPQGYEDSYLDFSADPESSAAWIKASDLVICMDCASFHRCGALEDFLRESSAVKVVIDHHPDPEEALFSLVISTVEVSSASELLYHILLAMAQVNGDASKLPAGTRYALMSGMTTDTNNLSNSVFPSTLRMASELLAAGVDRDGIIGHINNEFRENRLRLTGYLLERKLVIGSRGVAYTVLTREEQERFGIREGELEGFVNMPLQVRDVKISIFLREDEGHFRVSVRSKKGWSAKAVASGFFHGGGHEQASGGRLLFPQDIASPSNVEEYMAAMIKDLM